jgi:AbrB family looped-hinge helix DNA binding protein
MLAVSRVTSQYQATIPKEIRKKLSINSGDYVEFDIKNDNVVIKKINQVDKNFLKLTEQNLQEWNSKIDEKQFSYLKKFVK